MAADKSLLDPNDGIALRTYYESLRGKMAGDRSTLDPKWRQLEYFFAPRTAQWDYSDDNQYQREDQAIINETGGLALRTLRAGMLTGMSSQSAAWFKIGADSEELNDVKAVRSWCEEVEERVRKVFLKSNVYQSLLNLYGEEGLYGTSAFLVEEDEKTVIRCRPFTIGSYYLGMDDTLRIDLCLRVLRMTVRQIVERFGYENVSTAMQVQYDSNAGGNKEERYPIVHVIHKGSYFGPDGMKPPMPWVSIWYELSSFNERKGILRRSGFMESPLICGRWFVVGENVYGESAGMECLGSVMSLQAWEERTAQACEKQINPPMLASSELDPRRLGVLPGDISFTDSKDVSAAFRPAYQIDFRLEGASAMIQRIEARINDAMYRSLFQMFTDSDRREVTAEEIRAKMQEKMQVLGPVVERNVEEVLAPLVQRTVAIMGRRGLLPPMPPEMRGNKFKLEFISILAQAQKMRSITNLTQFVMFVGQESAVQQGILDNVDLDKAAQLYAELADVPADLLRTPDEVAAIRSDRQRQQQLAQNAENAQKLAGAAQAASQTPTGGDSLLDKVMPALAGGQQ